MNFSDVVKECQRLADMLADEIDGPGIHEALWETIDGHQWVIYTGKAWDVVNAARLAGGHWLDDAEGEVLAHDMAPETIDLYMVALAFWIMMQITRDCLRDIAEGVAA